MFDQLLDSADPHITNFIFTGITTYLGFVFRNVLKTKQSQESLHRALGTGVDLVTDILAAELDGRLGTSRLKATDSILIERVVDYVNASVPDAIRFLKADRRQLNKMAQAKISARVGELLKIK